MTYFHAKLHMPRSNSELLLLCMLFYMQKNILEDLLHYFRILNYIVVTAF
jgi:hypothetical protein